MQLMAYICEWRRFIVSYSASKHATYSAQQILLLTAPPMVLQIAKQIATNGVADGANDGIMDAEGAAKGIADGITQ